ncbi:threonine/serine exporter family protein [Microbacterium sp. KUDC0406]|uniref:threonine/serine ThrE exporter family protein n=1 Tax=Microbacterium sp. KUDC0406 TaxID=2909588 RepID=UPI001F3E5922|nr:threonine/serine exporter family protein [Microbacterium sp. KUDC0406]UJP10031.1 threonine/serine exporter family protein [Microbacterium sp. KUDC0406]
MRTPRSAPDTSARIRAILDLAIRLAMVMWRSGAGAQETTEAMLAITRAYGLRHIDADVSPGTVALTWTNASTDESISRRHNLPSRRLDYTRLTAAAALHGRIVARRIELEDAARQLARIRVAKPLTPAVVRRLGWAVVGGGAAVLLGGGALVAVVAFLAALLLDVVIDALERRGVPLMFRTFLGGVIGPVAAVVVRIIDPSASATLVVVSTVIVLLAGVTVLGGVQDILTGDYLTGLARLMEAIVATTGIAAGVMASSLLLELLGAPVSISVTEARPEQTPVVALIAAVVMALGFSLGTATPWRAFWAVALTAAIGEAVTVLAARAGFYAMWSAAFAAIAVGATASVLTRPTRTPALPLLVAALVPMLPGLLLFNGLMQLASASVPGLFDTIGAAAVAAALASGSICGNYLVRMVRRRAVWLSKL